MQNRKPKNEYKTKKKKQKYKNTNYICIYI